MHRFKIISTVIVWIWLTDDTSASSNVSCVSDWGCFPNHWPHLKKDSLKQPSMVIPSRKSLDVSLLLYTGIDTEPLVLRPEDNITQWQDTFFPSKRTVILLHGFMGGYFVQSHILKTIVQDVIDIVDCNVIVANWTKAARPPYVQAVLNTHYVGAEIAYRIRQLQVMAGDQKLHIHIIGASLGGQVAGAVGSRLNGTITRITALDPAQPFFERSPKTFQLDPSDAQFVDVIHTNPAYMGIKHPAGHMDFYPNNGKKQPGCNEHSTFFPLQTLVHVVARIIACDHVRSVEYYRENAILHGCSFVGYKCKNWNSFQRGECTRCGPDGGDCARMGWEAERDTAALMTEKPAIFYLKTNPSSPYCGFQYHILIELDHNTVNSRQLGLFQLRIIGETGKWAKTEDENSRDLVLAEDRMNSYVIISRDYLGVVETAYFAWTPWSDESKNNSMPGNLLPLVSATVTPMEYVTDEVTEATRRTLCPERDEPIHSEQVVLLTSQFCQ